MNVSQQEFLKAIIKAIKDNNYQKASEEVAKLSTNKADIINMRSDGSGFTPLNLAALKGNIEIAKLLIKNQADVNLGMSPGNPLLALVILKGNIEIAKLLIKNKADVNAYAAFGESLLNFAIRRDRIEIAKLLIKNKADVNSESRLDKFTPLHNSIDKGNIELVKLLIDNRANINAQVSDGWTPLNRALEKGKLECANFLCLQSHLNVSDTGAEENKKLFEQAIHGVAVSEEENRFELGKNIIHFLIKKKAPYHEKFVNNFMMNVNRIVLGKLLDTEEIQEIQAIIKSVWQEMRETTRHALDPEGEFNLNIEDDCVKAIARLSDREVRQLKQFVQEKGSSRSRLKKLSQEILSEILAFRFEEKCKGPIKEDESNPVWPPFQITKPLNTIFSRAFEEGYLLDPPPEIVFNQVLQCFDPKDSEEQEEPSSEAQPTTPQLR